MSVAHLIELLCLSFRIAPQDHGKAHTLPLLGNLSYWNEWFLPVLIGQPGQLVRALGLLAAERRHHGWCTGVPAGLLVPFALGIF